MKRKNYSIKKKNNLNRKIKTTEYGKKYYKNVTSKKKELTEKNKI